MIPRLSQVNRVSQAGFPKFGRLKFVSCGLEIALWARNSSPSSAWRVSGESMTANALFVRSDSRN